MSEKKLTIVTEKMLEVCEAILREGRAANAKELARAIGFQQGGLSEIYRGNRNFTDEMKMALCKKYNVNARYFLPPFEKKMFLENDTEKAIGEKLIQIEQLKKEIKLLKHLK